ncbi:MAG: hypothetical protein AAGF25_00925 [Pseudomonadota bacterium]
MAKKLSSDEERQRESERVLERVSTESEVVGTSSFVRQANRARDHLAGADGDQSDKVEVWAKRFGRGLSVAAFIFLAIWLVNFLGR